MQSFKNEVKEGLHRDFEEIDQPAGTYRESLNGDIYRIGDNRFGWKTKKGTLYSLSITAGQIPIYGIPIIDKLFIFSVSVTGYSEIGIVFLDEVNGSTYFILNNDSRLNFSKDHPIKGHGEKENEFIERLYWKDNYNNPRVLNVFDIINTYTSPYFSDLAANQKYLYVSGPGFIYSPDGIRSVSVTIGDIYFSNQDASVNNSIHHMVKYVPIEVMEWTPQATAGFLEFNSIVSGALLYGSYFITHRLGSNTGYATGWQKVLGPINIIDYDHTLLAGQSPTFPMDAYQAMQGKSHLVPSEFGIRLTLSSLDQNFDYVEIAYIQAIELDTSEGGFVTIKQPIVASTMTIDFLYNSKRSYVPIADIMTKNVPVVDFRDLTTLKGRMNIGNIVEPTELNLEQTIPNVVIREEIQHFVIDKAIGTITATGHASPNTEKALIDASVPIKGTSVSGSTPIGFGQRYKVKSNKTNPTGYFRYINADGTEIQYSTVDEIFVGKGGVGASYTTLDWYVVPVIQVRQYFNWPAQQSVYKTYELNYATDYKDPMMCLYGKGFWGNQKYRLGVMCFDKYLNPMYVRFLGDKMTSKRRKDVNTQSNITSTGAVAEYVDGTFNGATIDAELLQYEYDGSDVVTSGKILSFVIDNLDLTDIIHDISAFAIVICNREKTILSEGWLEPIVELKGTWLDEVQSTPENPGWIMEASGNTRFRSQNIVHGVDSLSTGTAYPRQRVAKYYAYIDPEKIFAKDPNMIVLVDDQIVIDRYMIDIEKGNESIRTLYPQINNEYTKYYAEIAPTFGYTPVETTAVIVASELVPESTIIQSYTDLESPGKWFRNICRLTEMGKAGLGSYSESVIYPNPAGACNIINIDNDGTGPNGFGYWNDANPTLSTQQPIPIVQHIRPSTQSYSGSNGFSLQSSDFHYTNHFQIVDDAFKNAIVQPRGRYIVHGIQIYGGDCFINIFDYKRNIVDDFITTHPPVAGEQVCVDGETIMIPLQTTTNLALRIGNHVAKNRSKGYNAFTDGICYNNEVTRVNIPSMWEEFLYDDSYSSKNVSIVFPGMPEILRRITRFEERIRWSLVKTKGEQLDSYRTFKSENYIDLNTMGGGISNIQNNRDRLYYWQKYICGYIPVLERQMSSTEVGLPVQLGIGGAYERYDDVSKFYGCSHLFGLTKTAEGFVWFDVVRNAWIHMSFDFGITEESVVKGLSNDFYNYVKDYMVDYDNPVNREGICLFYAPEEKIVYGLFQDPIDQNNNFAIGFNLVTKRYATNFDFFPFMAVLVGNRLYSSNGDESLWIHNRGELRTFYGVVHDAYVKLIVNPEPETIKAFHNAEMVQTEDFFDEVTYGFTTPQQIGNTFRTTITEIPATYPQYYENRMGSKWKFNFPADNGRITGLFLSLLFKNNSSTDIRDAKINTLITYFQNWL